MQLFAFTFLFFVVAFAGMALGVIAGRAPLRRGCGSLDGASCEACPRPCPHRGGTEGASR